MLYFLWMVYISELKLYQSFDNRAFKGYSRMEVMNPWLSKSQKAQIVDIFKAYRKKVYHILVRENLIPDRGYEFASSTTDSLAFEESDSDLSFLSNLMDNSVQSDNSEHSDPNSDNSAHSLNSLNPSDMLKNSILKFFCMSKKHFLRRHMKWSFVYEKMNQNKVISGSTQYLKRNIFLLVAK